MSDWQVGDLAVCVDTSDAFGGYDAGSSLTLGRVYRVEAIAAPALWKSGETDIGLVMCGIVRPWGYNDFHPSRFRKIRPDEQEACEPEFVTLLKRSKQRVVA